MAQKPSRLMKAGCQVRSSYHVNLNTAMALHLLPNFLRHELLHAVPMHQQHCLMMRTRDLTDQDLRT